MKRGPWFLSFGFIVVILFASGCGSVTNPLPASLATTTPTGSGSSGATTSGGGESLWLLERRAVRRHQPQVLLLQRPTSM